MIRESIKQIIIEPSYHKILILAYICINMVQNQIISILKHIIFHKNILYPNEPSMLIQPQQYLNLTDQLAHLNLKCKTIEQQNAKLNALVIEQKETIKLLNQRVLSEVSRKQLLQKQLIQTIDARCETIVGAVTEAKEEKIKVLIQEIQKIKSDANVQTIKQLEKKMTQNRFKNHEMVDFYQKIQSLYMVINNTRTVPSMNELYKWASLRKAQQMNVPSSNNINPGTQKSFLTTSKMNISKMNTSKINTSKINQQKMNVSKMNKSKMNASKIKNSPILNNWQNVSRININLNQSKSVSRPQLSSPKGNKNPSAQRQKHVRISQQLKLQKQKQNRCPQNNPKQEKQKKEKKQKKKQKSSGTSLTQQMDLDNQILSLNQLENQMNGLGGAQRKGGDLGIL